MRTAVNEPVKVRLDIDSINQAALLRQIRWQGKVYAVEETGMAYSVRDGRRNVHVFWVNVGVLDMRVHVDGDTLHAVLIEVSDGLAD